MTMLADVHVLYRSDFYRILDYKCRCDICSLSEPEYSKSFCVSFIRKGFFEYRVFRSAFEAHVGRLLLSKPGCEHRARHIVGQPDITTIFDFRASFFEAMKNHYGKEARWFLQNNDLHALLLQCPPGTEYLHHRILQAVQSGQAGHLRIDDWVIRLLDRVMRLLGHVKEPAPLPDSLKKYHLGTIETASAYILQHFRENISLHELARHCCVSPFHFSRVFKSFMQVSPHRYLVSVRLDHAKILLHTSDRPVSDIAFECGFNSLEHFATAYRGQFGRSPSRERLNQLT